MPTIKVNTSTLSSKAAEILNVYSNVESIFERYNRAKRDIDNNLSSGINWLSEERLDEVKGLLTLRKTGDFLQFAADCYEQRESVDSISIDVDQDAKQILQRWFLRKTVNQMVRTITGPLSEYFKTIKAEDVELIKKKKKSKEQTKETYNIYGAEGKWDKEKRAIYSERWIDKEKEMSCWSPQEPIEWGPEYARGSLDVGVVNAKTYGYVEAGFYEYEIDENGNEKKRFSPGVKAEVGSSFSLLSGKLELKQGNENFNLHEDLSVEVGSVEASAGLALKKGEIHGSLSAEVDLFKVGGTVGVTVLGAEINGSADIKFGFGGHIDAGWKDGKLKCDMGLAFGLGVDLSFEIDIGGTVNAVRDWCGSALRKIKFW